jgi:hypothetical protein
MKAVLTTYSSFKWRISCKDGFHCIYMNHKPPDVFSSIADAEKQLLQKDAKSEDQMQMPDTSDTTEQLNAVNFLIRRQQTDPVSKSYATLSTAVFV